MKHLLSILVLFSLTFASSCYPWHNDLFPDFSEVSGIPPVSGEIPDFKYPVKELYYNNASIGNLYPSSAVDGETLPSEGVTWAITSRNKPDWLSINADTGALSGTVSVPSGDSDPLFSTCELEITVSMGTVSKKGEAVFHLYNKDGTEGGTDAVVTDSCRISASASLSEDLAVTLTVGSGETLTVNGPGTMSIPYGTSVILQDGAKITLENGASIDENSQHQITFQITTTDGFETFADMVNTLPGINGVLGGNVSVGEVQLPLCSKTAPYTGTFDGGGNTLSGIKNPKGSMYSGIFVSVGTDGTVENLTASGYVNDTIYGGLITSKNYGTIRNCTAGSSDGCSIQNAPMAGGICAYNYGTVDSCINHAYVSNNGDLAYNMDNNKNMFSYLGGIAAVNYGEIRNCMSFHALGGVANGSPGESCHVYVGGIAGVNAASAKTINCLNGENVNAELQGSCSGGASSGGIAGYNERGGYVCNCANTAYINCSNFRRSNDGYRCIYSDSGTSENLINNFSSVDLNTLNEWVKNSDNNPDGLYKNWILESEKPVLDIN